MNARVLILARLETVYRQDATGFVLLDSIVPKKNDPEFVSALNRLLQEGLIHAFQSKSGIVGRINPARLEQITSELRACDVFVSYSKEDKAIAEEIANEIRRSGFSVFLSHQTITVGPQWEDQVAEAARSCRIAVLVLSQNAKNSDWVRYEIGALWALKKKVAPALIGLQPSDIPALAQKYQGRSVLSPVDRQAYCDEILRLLKNQ